MDIKTWLEDLGLAEHASSFAENGVDEEILRELDNEDLKDLGVARLADRKRLLKAIAALDDTDRIDEPAGDGTQMPRHGERRPVAVLFADLSSFTRLSNKLGAEKIHAVLNGYFEAADSIIERFGGRVDKHIGDSVMAVFGAPVAHTNDSERAVRAALEIHAAMAGLSVRFGEALSVHIGIASGQVVVSETGSDSHREYTATGDTVNLASRLNDLAGDGETLVSNAIQATLATVAKFSARGTEEIKGFSEPIPVWALDMLDDAEPARPDGAFIGRRTEIAQFTAGLENCRESQRGHGIVLRGDPGIGKSRLVSEFASLADQAGFACYRALVLDFGAGKGQDAIRALVRNLLQLGGNDDMAARRHAAEEAMAKGWTSKNENVLLNDLLDIPQSEENMAMYSAMDAETRKSGRQSVLSGLIRSASVERPTMIVIEDIHWADPVVLDDLSAVANVISRTSAVLVLTSRLEGPVMDHGWLSSLGNLPLSTIDLPPLRASEALTLAGQLGTEQRGAIEKLIERAGGNPLFLELLIRNFAEQSSEELPDTVHGVVLARVDRLSVPNREVLQSASILGQRFSLEALRSITEDPRATCDALIAQRLLRSEGDTLVFAHALIRDGVYASLLEARKRALHSLAADWYASRDLLLCAEHLDCAQDHSAANVYLEAAREQFEAFHFERAIQLAQRGIEIAQQRGQKFRLRLLLGEITREKLDLPAAKEAFAMASETAEAAEEKCTALIGMASVFRLTDNHQEALNLLDEAENLGSAMNMPEKLSELHHLRGNLYFPLGRSDDCFAEHEKALEYAKQANSTELEVRALGGLGDAEYARGHMRAAHMYFSECLELSRKHQFTRIEVVNANMLGGGGTCYYLNDLRTALQVSIDAAEKAERAGMQRAELLAHISLSMSYFEIADFERAESHNRTVKELAELSGTRRFLARSLHQSGKLFLEYGERAAAVENLREAYSVSVETGVGYCGALILASLARATDDPDERAKALSDGAELLKKGCVSHNYFEYYCEAMELMLDEGNWDAVEPFATALVAFTAAEPLPRSEFFILRARTLAKFGAGTRSEAVLTALKQLQNTAHKVGLNVARKAIDRAVSSVV